jgi:Transposase IS4
VAFLNNLFLNIDIAHALLKMGIGVMGTTRKNSKGFPEPFLNIKEINSALIYGGYVSIVKGEALCFAWQDNNVVLGITTAFSLDKGDGN